MSTTPEQFLQSACATIGTLGQSYYFTAETQARGQALGLDPVGFYFLGRGGLLGDVEAAVVQSAFGYFEPSMLAGAWNRSRQVVEPRRAATELLEACHDFGRAHFADVAELTDFCAAGEAVLGAADPTGLALFAGALTEPLPGDPPARAMHLVAVLREFRGSAHLLAVVASGVAPATAHYLRYPDRWTLFGYQEADVPAPSEQDRDNLAAADALTDRICAPAYGVLDDFGRGSILVGLERMEAALALGAAR